ncbi:MAG TPA: recombination mediator RecR [Candidatus Kapabacteria bacterium]|nr:recombination mediator RecR [Candidatus Kapabacteria bacterium]
MYAKPIQRLIAAFTRLPSVGHRTAERFSFYLLKSGKKEVAELTLALKRLIETIKSCETCWDFSDQSPCHICSDKTRDQKTICVVAEPQDLHVIEHMGIYHGQYHVLRGTFSPDTEDPLRCIKIPELLKRIENTTITEIILALNPDLPGETTMMFLEKQLQDKRKDMKVSRLARGLPMGSDLQYADEITLGSAFKHRTPTH